MGCFGSSIFYFRRSAYIMNNIYIFHKKLIIKKIVLLASAVVFLMSCEVSKKGEWTEDDMNACIADGKAEIKEDAELREIVEMFDLDVSEFTTCVCKNAEKQYESYEEADKVLSDDNLSEEKAMEVFGDCFGDEFKDMMEGVEGELDYE